MSGNAYRNRWKYMVMRSGRTFKALIYSETHQHQSQIDKTVLKSVKQPKQIEKTDKILGNITKN